MIRAILIILSLSGCSTQYQMRVISVTDPDTKQCIQNNAIICEYTAK